MITLEDIRTDLSIALETDDYYWDALKGIGYHIHKEQSGNCIFMKNTGKRIIPISEEEFIDAVNNKCFGCCISADSYYTFR